MFFRQPLNDRTACASYLFGCTTHPNLTVVDPIDLVDAYIARAEVLGAPIVAVLDTHVQADHVSGMAEIVARTGASAYLPEGSGVVRSASEEEFVAALTRDIPRAPEQQAAIVAANRSGRPLASVV